MILYRRHFLLLPSAVFFAFSMAFACGRANAQGRRPAAGSLPTLQSVLPPVNESRNPTSRIPGNGNASEIAHQKASGFEEAVRPNEQRQKEVRNLLRLHGDVLEENPSGEAVVRREILAWLPSPAALAAAHAAGLTVLREIDLDGLDQKVVVFTVPEDATTSVTLEKLRMTDPSGSYDFNHIYTRGSAVSMNGAIAVREDVQHTAGNGNVSGKIGLVDGGVDVSHVVFRDVSIQRWGCDGQPHPSDHGTAVAALMVGQSPNFHGVLANANLYAADVYCGGGTGGSVEKIAAALAWLAREKIAVINLSLVGPTNQTLERVVTAMFQRGHLLVAAVGNDGPAAPPLYPASYPGVIGVGAVDKEGRCLPESARGAQVMFAAPGSHMVTAALGSPPFRQVRGTSFASPIVAALLAAALHTPDKTKAMSALATLAKQAKRQSPTVVSNETGYGIVGQTYRIDPAAFH